MPAWRQSAAGFDVVTMNPEAETADATFYGYHYIGRSVAELKSSHWVNYSPNRCGIDVLRSDWQRNFSVFTRIEIRARILRRRAGVGL